MSQLVGIVVSLFGGLGLFLFGMHIMSEGLERAAGDSMSQIIEKMTGTLLKGVFAGALVTALIQSSSATTVMVIGFVNSGIMKLSQTVGVIMGANIGTTITAQLLSLSELNGNAWYFAILKPANFAPVLVFVGVFILLFSKKKSQATLGSILAGFGMIFVGMSTMENAVRPLQELDAFRYVFESLQNPILGVLAGMAVTAIIQSSSASVGILQAATITGTVTFSAAAPIILGQNIGTCVTALLSGVGASKNARKASYIHLLFNVIGMLIFLPLLYFFQDALPFYDAPINKSGIANFHLIFNIANTLVLLPFSKQLVKLSDLLVKDKKKGEERSSGLDVRFLSTPALAVSQASRATINMAHYVTQNLKLAQSAYLKGQTEPKDTVLENEEVIDSFESDITRYLVQIVDENLSQSDSKTTSGLFHILIDIERVGDHAQSLFQLGAKMRERKIQFSVQATQELTIVTNAVTEIFESAILSYEQRSLELARRVITYENVMDDIRKILRNHHVDRLSRQECDFDAAVLFLDILSHLERIADHSGNIANRVEQILSEGNNFDLHRDAKAFRTEHPDSYQSYYDDFIQKYPI